VSIPSASSQAQDSEQRSDQAKFTAAWTATARSGSPDSDAWGDAWVNAAVGQTGTNNGNAANLDCTNLVTGQRRAIIEFDLTRFTGHTAAGNTHTLAVSITAGALGGATVSFDFSATTSRPWTESTVTNANLPASTTLFTLTAVTTAGATQTFNLTLTDAQLAQLLGKWVQVLARTPAATTSTHTVAGRESASKPVLTFTTTI
jgi:hypothetical protein